VKKPSAYPILDWLQKQKLEPTRENYLAIDRCEPNPTLTAEEEAMLPPQFRRPVPMTPGEFHNWSLENWLRCRCECDDLFDMCLNCLTHRQLTDLIQ